jgi:hypothetical protein
MAKRQKLKRYQYEGMIIEQGMTGAPAVRNCNRHIVGNGDAFCRR